MAMVDMAHIPGTHYAMVPVAALDTTDATATVGAWVAPFRCKVKSVEYIPFTAVTGADTNSRNLNVMNGTDEVANVDFVGGVDVAALERKALTLTAANVNVEAGDVLALSGEKVGTGAALSAGMVRIGYEAR